MCLIFSPVVTSEKFSGGKSSASSSGCSCCGSSTDSGATMATPPSSNRVSGLSTSLVCVLLRLLFPSSRLSQLTLQFESLEVSCLRSALDRSAHVDINASWPLRYPLVLLKGCHCTQDANSVQHTQSEHELRVLALDSSK